MGFKYCFVVGDNGGGSSGGSGDGDGVGGVGPRATVAKTVWGGNAGTTAVPTCPSGTRVASCVRASELWAANLSAAVGGRQAKQPAGGSSLRVVNYRCVNDSSGGPVIAIELQVRQSLRLSFRRVSHCD